MPNIYRRAFILLCKKNFKPSFLKKLEWWYSFYAINQKKKIQKNEFEAMKNILQKENPFIIDGGANVGLYTLFLKLYFPDATVHCFEPNTSLPIEENLSHLDDIHITYMALGNENKMVDFYVNDYDAASSVFVRKTQTSQKKIRVPMVTIDSIFSEEEVDILKLDLEGFDYQALLGAKETLKHTKIVFIEVEFQPDFWYGQEKTIFDVHKLLEPYGFRLHSIYDMGFNEKGEIQTTNAMFVKY